MTDGPDANSLDSKLTDSLDDRIADALLRLATLLRAADQARSAADTLSPLQARALAALLRRGEFRVGAIAEELMVTPGTMSVALTALEQKGLVTRGRDPHEHRARTVTLTRKGRSLARRATGWAPAVLEPGLRALPRAEAETLLTTLLKLILGLERAGVIARSRICVTCRHFEPHGGDAERPHYCRLLRAPIAGPDLRVDCPDHERADDAQLDAVRVALER